MAKEIRVCKAHIPDNIKHDTTSEQIGRCFVCGALTTTVILTTDEAGHFIPVDTLADRLMLAHKKAFPHYYQTKE